MIPDPGAVRAVWADAVAAPDWAGPALWLHGDLHAANVLVHDGRLSGVIDFGDLTSGDPATDLAVAWIMFDEPHRATFRQRAGQVDSATWTRAEGWALAFGVGVFANSPSGSRLHRMGERTLAAVLTD